MIRRPPISTLFPYTPLSRSRPDEPGHGVLLHVLRHVDLDHRVLVREQEFRERARKLGLPHAGRAEEDERAGRALRRSEEHTSELQSQSNLVCRLLLEKKKET